MIYAELSIYVIISPESIYYSSGFYSSICSPDEDLSSTTVETFN